MALSGSFSGSVFNDHHKVRVDWTATQNVANNTSTITAKLYYVHDWSISISARSSAHSVTIDGTTTTFSSSAISASSGEHLIGTATKTISHNSDGTKSISMSASFALRATLNGTYYGNITASATITLDTIARASQPTVSASSVDMGGSVTITTNRASSSFTHTLEYAFEGTTGTIATGVGASYQWTVPLTLANSLPDYIGSTLTITCKTYNGSTLIGTKTVNIIASVPSSIVPTISAITCKDLYGYATTYGAYIQYKSKLNVAVTAAGAYSSTIKSYKIEANQTSYNYNNCTTDVLRRYGSQTVTVTVTDSRGRTTTSTATITVLQYTSPSISTLTAYRCLSDGTEDEAGAYMKVTIGASITSLNSKNAKTFSLLYKTKSATSYTTNKTWSAYTLSTSVIIAASVDYSYDIKVQAIDSFGTVEASTAIGTSFTLMDFRNTGGGIAFGKASEQDAFECAIKAIMSGKVSIGGYVNDSYALATNGLISNEWLRTVGTCGWLSQTYGGGWYMNDANWIKAYADKGVSTGGTIKGGAVQTVAGADLDSINTRVGTAESNISTINSNIALKKATVAITTADNGLSYATHMNFYKMGRIVVCTYTNNWILKSANTDITLSATIPSEYLPVEDAVANVIALNQAYSNHQRFYFRTTGKIVVLGNSTFLRSVPFTVTWISAT